MNKTKIISFVSYKGGVSKTTSAIYTADILSFHGRTLLIDSDPQSSITSYHLNPKRGDKYHHIYDVIENKIDIEDAIINIKNDLDLLPGNELFTNINEISKEGYQFLLKKKITGLEYDYIVMDSHPSKTKDLTNVLVCSTDVFIPVIPGIWSIEVIESITDLIKDIKEYYNPQMNEPKLFLTKFEKNHTASIVALDLLKNRSEFLNIIIPNGSVVEKTFLFRHDLNRKNAIYKGYTDLMEGILNVSTKQK